MARQLEVLTLRGRFGDAWVDTSRIEMDVVLYVKSFEC